MNSPRAQAIQRLRSLVAASPHTALPPIRHLAALWTMSPRTVQQAITEGVADGWLESHIGSGVWPIGKRPTIATIARRMDAQRLAHELADKIYTGKFLTSQPLPAPKTLAREYEIHPSTVRKALRQLQSQHILSRSGRSWSINLDRSHSSNRKQTLLCFGSADDHGNLRMDTDREWDFWREIQAEAIRCGLTPQIIPWKNELPTFGNDVFGAIVSTWHQTNSLPLLEHLSKLKLPTAVWVANQEELPGPTLKHARTLWFHDLGYGKEAGRTMAKYLRNESHRNLAWISPFHKSTWARNRLAGLRETLPSDFHIAEYVGDWISEWDIQAHLATDPSILQRIDVRDVEYGEDLSTLTRPLVEVLTRQTCLEIFAPKLEMAFNSGATLWIAASDLIAQWCQYWLKQKNIRIPDDLSILSFDDTREATRTNLTSLRHDVPGMARTMLRQIVSSQKIHHQFTRHAGEVVVRGSSQYNFLTTRTV